MLDDPERLYQWIATYLARGKYIPVLGAGVNRCERPAGVTWERGRYLPDGRELAEELARRLVTGPVDDLAKVSQYISARNGRLPLYEELHNVFDADYPPTRLHRFLARLSSHIRNQCMLLVTTNYDDSLERAFSDEREPFDLVTYIAEGSDRGRFHYIPAEGTPKVIRNLQDPDIRLDRRPVIVKIHGAVDRRKYCECDDSFVITEDDYTDYLTRADLSKLLPKILAAKLAKSPFLFLGYSLKDWNVRVMLYRLAVARASQTVRSVAIQQVDTDPVEVMIWENRGVDILPVGLDRFLSEVEQRLSALQPSSR